jgi:hypothetical protein
MNIISFLDCYDLKQEEDNRSYRQLNSTCANSLPKEAVEFARFMPGGHSDAVPPDPISNSEVKRISGNGSVGSPHARVAHRQAPN